MEVVEEGAPVSFALFPWKRPSSSFCLVELPLPLPLPLPLSCSITGMHLSPLSRSLRFRRLSLLLVCLCPSFFQESPESIPEGETPHTVDVCAWDTLVDAVRPGDRVQITGIYRAV